MLISTLLFGCSKVEPTNNRNFAGDFPDMNAREGSREVIFNPANKEKIEHAVIWLHGLGATADDFPPVVPYLGLDQQRAIRFVFPQAPSRPISINGGMVMPGWYDIAGTSIGDKEDRHGMQESQAMLEALIAEQIELGIPSNKLIAAGFSQGGAVAYYTALRSKHRLAGVLALSTYLPFATQAAEEQSKVNVDTPIFAAHGEIDPMVPVQMGKTSVDALQSLGYKVAWKTYPMAHEVNMDELKDIGSWINQLYAGRL